MEHRCIEVWKKFESVYLSLNYFKEEHATSFCALLLTSHSITFRMLCQLKVPVQMPMRAQFAPRPKL